jgi:hypothetical protein
MKSLGMGEGRVTGRRARPWQGSRFIIVCKQPDWEGAAQQSAAAEAVTSAARFHSKRHVLWSFSGWIGLGIYLRYLCVLV